MPEITLSPRFAGVNVIQLFVGELKSPHLSKIVDKELHHQLAKVPGMRRNPDAMSVIWRNHQVKVFALILQSIDELIGITDVHVVVLRTMDHQQFSMKIFCGLYD